jgi:serine/threonine protein kinase/tetratricopeptide (TPR) repeat protein
LDPRHLLTPGLVLDHTYRIERVLGAGGFGITYEATDLGLANAVAIKEYYPAEFGSRDETMSVGPRTAKDKDLFERCRSGFLREAQTLAQFDHPAIVRVLRIFEAHGTAYMVMRYEQGQSLIAWLKSLGRPPTQDEIDRVALPMLDAVELLHRASYLHRDIAPDNIIIRADGSPVLLDFGAARQQLGHWSATITGLVKKGYSPQEQYASESKLQGPWSDVYALGATLYRAVTGERPPEATERMLDDQLRPAGELAPKDTYRAGFLGAIDAALKTRPGERPQSIDAFRALLSMQEAPAATAPAPTETMATAHPVATVPTAAGADAAMAVTVTAVAVTAASLATPTPSRAWRSPALAAGLALAIVAAGAGWWLSRTEQRPLGIATVQVAEAVADVPDPAAPAIPPSLRPPSALAPPVEPAPYDRRPPPAVAVLPPPVATPLPPPAAPAEPAPAPAPAATVPDRTPPAPSPAAPAAPRPDEADKERARREAEAAEQRRIAHIGRQRDLVHAYRRSGDDLVAQGRVGDALKAYEKAHAILEELAAGEPDETGWSREIAETWMRVARALAQQRSFAEAHLTLDKSERILTVLSNLEPASFDRGRDLILAIERRAELQLNEGEFAKGLATLRDVRARRERLAGQHPDNKLGRFDVATSHMQIGSVLLAQRKFNEAEKAFVDGLAAAERARTVEPEKPAWIRLRWQGLSGQADALMGLSRGPEALKRFQDAHALLETLVSAEPANPTLQYDLFNSYGRLGSALIRQQNAAGALRSFKSALAIAERNVARETDGGEWRRHLAMANAFVGDAHAMQGQLAEAVRAHRAVLQIRQAAAERDPGNPSHRRDIATSHYRVGALLLQQRRFGEAEAELVEALSERQRLLAAEPQSPPLAREVAITYDGLAALRVQSGKVPEALAPYREALAIRERLATAEPDNARIVFDLGLSHINVAAVLTQTRSRQEALRHLRLARTALQGAQKRIADNPAWRSEIDTLLAQVAAGIKQNGG